VGVQFLSRPFLDTHKLFLFGTAADRQQTAMPPKRKREENQNEALPAKKAKIYDNNDKSVQLPVNTKKNTVNKPRKTKIDPKIPLHSLNNPFPTVFDVISKGDDEEPDAAEPFTKDELEIMKISQSIREKPNWLSKFLDNQIRRKWKAEALDQGKYASNE